MFLAYEDLTVIDGLLFSLVAIVMVFAVLAILVLAVSLMSKINFEKAKEQAPETPIAVAPQKKFSVEDIKDEDMMVAALVATADFIEETKKTDARVVSIKQIG